jgi:hypothetical protein
MSDVIFKSLISSNVSMALAPTLLYYISIGKAKRTKCARRI